MREEIPISEKVLQTLHNLCATARDLARKSEELAQFLQLDKGEIERILDGYSCNGYVESFVGTDGRKWYYLTGRGIIKVCALFT